MKEAGRITASEEPHFDAPPVMPGQGERRMHMRAYHHWSSLLRGRICPTPADVDFGGTSAFGAHAMLLDCREDSRRPVLRHLGARLGEQCGIDPRTVGLPIAQRSLPAFLAGYLSEIRCCRSPVSFEAEFRGARGMPALYRGILLPLGSDGRTVDHICGVLNWKQLAEATLEEDLQIEAGLIERASDGHDFHGDGLPPFARHDERRGIAQR